MPIDKTLRSDKQEAFSAVRLTNSSSSLQIGGLFLTVRTVRAAPDSRTDSWAPSAVLCAAAQSNSTVLCAAAQSNSAVLCVAAQSNTAVLCAAAQSNPAVLCAAPQSNFQVDSRPRRQDIGVGTIHEQAGALLGFSQGGRTEIYIFSGM